MKQFHFTGRYEKWIFIPVVIMLILITGNQSCTTKKDKSYLTFSEDTLAASDVSCMTLSKEKINRFWIPAHTDPTKPDEKIAVLKLYTLPIPGTESFVVYVQGFNSKDQPVGKYIELGEGVACLQNLPFHYRGNTIDIYFDKLHITDNNGKLVENFEKLVFTPGVKKIEQRDYLYFKVESVIGDTRAQLDDGLPCPPCINCKPPCPPDCSPACSPTDSTDSGLIILDTTDTTGSN